MPQTVMEDAGSAADERIDVSALQAENASLQDRLLRALAEAENTRRRAERAVQDARQYAISDFARELLAVADNLQRTIEAAERHGSQSPQEAALLEGVRATERQLLQVFERFGVRKIEAEGAPFDPNLHEAVMQEEDMSHPPGTVIRVLEDGYTIHGRLLRPARVVVSKRSANAPPPQEAAATGRRSSNRFP
jgi:molecular chaperone GrpE